MDSEEPPNVRVAERGVAGFYVGPVADHINRAVGAAGGALRCEDLHLHRTDFEPTIETTYRGWRIHQTGLPSQGMILLEALNIAECEPASHLAEINAHAVHMSAELLKLAYADRLAYACDPKFAPTPLDSLLSKTWARRRYEAIDRLRASETAMAGALADGDTTYLCAADGEGGMVSLIQSVSSAFGSGLVAGGTGVLLNNRVGRGFSLIEGDPNIFAPGKKTMNTLNCYMVTNAGGEPVAVGGTPGGDGQPQWNLQVLTALIDGGLDVQAAVEAPRWSIWPGTDPADRPNPFELRIETRVEPSTLDHLADLGHRVKASGDWNGGGGAQLIVRHPGTRVLAGGSDPRVEGFALGL
ncbi:MAG: gamma-glutamyltransferase [Sphingomonadales bacterium]|jgi:gamma-glutamyltranspeptidase/glutathione hydrolase|nr:gamma-glutamyltransferase [Sphingomonadales bacterium]